MIFNSITNKNGNFDDSVRKTFLIFRQIVEEDMFENTLSRREYIKSIYKMLDKNFFEKEFKLEEIKEQSIKYETNKIFSFPAISENVAKKLIQECTNFSNSNLPIVSPNPYSIANDEECCILNEFAKKEISPFINSLAEFINHLFPQYGKMSDSDFLAFFSKNENENFSSFHTDESHFTVSICLNEEFEGGEFVFYNQSLVIPQRPFHAVAFLGSTPHSTRPTKGKRYNLIIYMKQDLNKDEEYFYDQKYIEYLSLMSIKNVIDFQHRKIAFTVPTLNKLEKIGSNINLTFNGNERDLIRKIPSWNFISIFKYLRAKDLSAVELTCKGFKNLSELLWKEKYIKEVGDFNIKNTFTNYKTLFNSMHNGRKSLESENKYITIHLDDNIGEEFLKYVSSCLGIRNHLLDNSLTPTELFFNETSKGYYEPRTLFLKNSLYNPSRNTISNCDTQNIFLTNSSNEATFDSTYDTNLTAFFERLRKISESCSKYKFLISCESTSFSVSLTSLVHSHLQDYYNSKHKVITPLLNEHDLNTAILLNNVSQETPVMQYEHKKIKETLSDYEISGKYNQESLIARAMYGIGLLHQFDLSTIVPYPGISLLQQSFWPITHEKFSLGEITFNSIMKPIMNFRYEPIVKTCGLALNFIGDILPKDVMAVVGSIKTKREIQFVDWVPTGFKCSINYFKEKVNDQFLDKSCHCFANTRDSLYFYRELADKIKEENFQIEKIDINEVKNFIDERIIDYTEIMKEPDENEKYEDEVEN